VRKEMFTEMSLFWHSLRKSATAWDVLLTSPKQMF
jgi:hypothetical protein